MSLCGVVGVDDLLLLAKRGGRLLGQRRERAGHGGTYGRKLQAELGRLATRVKISEMRRCWTLVSWAPIFSIEGWGRWTGGSRYQLGVELGQARLAGVVEDEHGVDHGGWRLAAGGGGGGKQERVGLLSSSHSRASLGDRRAGSMDAGVQRRRGPSSP